MSYIIKLKIIKIDYRGFEVVIIHNRYVIIFFLCVFSIATDAVAMFPMGAKHRVTPEQRQKALDAIKILHKEKITPLPRYEFDHKEEIIPIISNCKPDEIMLYPGHSKHPTTEGICFSENIIRLSDTIKDQIEDLGGKEKSLGIKIPISHSFDAIKNSHAILTRYAKEKSPESKEEAVRDVIQAHSFQQLVDVANCLNYLRCPLDIEKVMTDTMKKRLLAGSKCLDGVDFNLYPDLKAVAIDPLINWVKNLMIVKNVQDKNKKKILDQKRGLDITFKAGYHLNCFKNIAIDPMNNNIVFNQNNNIIISNTEGKKLSTINVPEVQISFPILGKVYEIITSKDCKYIAYIKDDTIPCIKAIQSPQETVEFTTTENLANKRIECLSFNHDNTQLAASYFDFVIVWDISKPKDPMFLQKYNSYKILSIAFSPNGKQIAIGGMQQDLSSANMYKYVIKIINASTGDFINSLVLPNAGVTDKVIFTPNGEKIIANGYKTQQKIQGNRTTYSHESNLIVWNVKGIEDMEEEHSYKKLDYALIDTNALAISSDGKRMVTSGSQQNPNTLELWDLSNDDKTTHQTIAQLDGPCNSLAFNNDDTMLVSGDGYGAGLPGYKTSLIRWDILSKEQKEMAEDIKNYDTDRIRLLYQLYLNEPVTNPALFGGLPLGLENVLPKPSNDKVTTQEAPNSRSWMASFFDRLYYYYSNR